MVFASVARASALSAPSWVPTAVSGWTLGYEGPVDSTYGAALDFGDSGPKVLTNWTQVWYMLSSGTTNGIIGVLAMEFDQDYFSKTLSADVKSALSMMSGYGLPAFSGNTVWDVLVWYMGLLAYYGTGSAAIDETSSISGATKAISISLDWGTVNFYLLYAYAGPKTMCIFSLTIAADFSSYDSSGMYDYMKPYLSTVAYCFGTVLVAVAALGMSAVIPEAVLDDQAPKSSANTSVSDTKSFASTYVAAVAATNASSVPGYPIAIIGAAAIFAAFLIVRKKKMCAA
jgi:hypothetical protein